MGARRPGQAARALHHDVARHATGAPAGSGRAPGGGAPRGARRGSRAGEELGGSRHRNGAQPRAVRRRRARNLDRVRPGGGAGDVRGARGAARRRSPQRHDGGALGRGAGELARAGPPGAEVAAHDGRAGGPPALVEALDGFDAALAEVLAAGQPPTPSAAARDALLAAYAPLAPALPRAFELEGERDRREPLIVRALLEQVPGLEPLMIEKLMAAGFGRLAALYAARADEIAAVTGIPDAVAAATAARIQAFRRATPAALAAVDPARDSPRAGPAAGRAARPARRVRGALARLVGEAIGTQRDSSGGSGNCRCCRSRSRSCGSARSTSPCASTSCPSRKKIDELDRLIGRAAQAAKAKHRADAPAATVAAAAT